MAGHTPRLYLVDGSSYVYRAFFALPALTSPAGLPTNAVYGFTTMLLKLLDDAKPEYMGVIFDAPGPTFRDQIFADYKANRPPTPEDLIPQVPLIHRIVGGFRLYTLAIPGVEADDVIATLTTHVAAEKVECVVVTGDKDLMQLVGPRVRLWDTMRDRWTDAAAVRARFGVTPAQLVDVMALMGDATDNIPGVKGVGEKTAVALVQRFGNLEAVLAHLPEIERMNLRWAKRVAQRLREEVAVARLSRTLASVRRDVPVSCTLADFRITAPDVSMLRALCAEFGFHSLLGQLSASATTVAVEADLITDAKRAAKQFTQARADGWLALATVAGPGPAATTPAQAVVLATSGQRPVRIPVDDAKLLQLTREALRDPPFELLVHDLKRDILQLAARGVAVGGQAFDVMIASYLVDAPGTHSLEGLAAAVLGTNLAAFRNGVEGVAAGVSCLPSLADHLRRRLRELRLEQLFKEVEMPLSHVLANIERRGMLIDTDRLRALGNEFTTRLEALMREIYALAGEEFNINSPSQLRAVLFDRLGLSRRGVRRGKTGYSTDVDVLTRLANVHPLPAKIMEYRGLAKLKSTYVDALPAAVNPSTGRLHTTFHQTVAATGRLSSSDPNLQNIPVRGEDARRIRQAFTAPPGYVLVAADYSQIELRVLAHLSRDPALVEAFRRDQDIHARTAAELFGVLPGTVTDEMRRIAKVVNFGILYGMGPQRLAHELGIAIAEAQRYIANYFDRYGGVRRYMETVITEACERGFVTTILGRRRAVPELRSTERGVAQAAERVATNTPVQGSAADLIKLAMLAVERRLAQSSLRAGMVLQVHDELLLEVAEPDREATCTAVRAEMEGVMPLAVPLRVDIGIGRTWDEAH